MDQVDSTGNFTLLEAAGAADVSGTTDSIAVPEVQQVQARTREETLYIRSFAPWKTFGGGFSGDNRGFTTSREKAVTSRITGIVKFFIYPIVILSQTAHSDPSHHPLRGTATGTPAISVSSSGNNMDVSIAGSNPLIPSPDIDLDLGMSVVRATARTHFIGNLFGDAFPNAEVFIVDQHGRATMLLTFATQGGPITGPPEYLPGNFNRPMGSFSTWIGDN